MKRTPYSVKRTSHSVKGPWIGGDRHFDMPAEGFCYAHVFWMEAFERLFDAPSAYGSGAILFESLKTNLCAEKKRSGKSSRWDPMSFFEFDCSEPNLVQLENRKQKRQLQRTGRKKFCCVQACGRPLCGDFCASVVHIYRNQFRHIAFQGPLPKDLCIELSCQAAGISAVEPLVVYLLLAVRLWRMYCDDDDYYYYYT